MRALTRTSPTLKRALENNIAAAVEEKKSSASDGNREAVADAVRRVMAEQGFFPESVNEVMRASDALAETAKKAEQDAAQSEKDRALQKKQLEKALKAAGNAKVVAQRQFDKEEAKPEKGGRGKPRSTLLAPKLQTVANRDRTEGLKQGG